MPELTKEERIKVELDRISFLFEKADANEKALAFPLIQNAAFMRVTLEDLQKIINEEGVTEVYQNGANQHGVKQSATLQSYNALVKNFGSVIKALSAILPPEEKKTVRAGAWAAPEISKEERAERAREEKEKMERINEEVRRASEWQREQWAKEGRI